MFKINARPYECQNRCQIDWQFECQGLCLKECQLSWAHTGAKPIASSISVGAHTDPNTCQKECQNLCQIKCLNICQRLPEYTYLPYIFPDDMTETFRNYVIICQWWGAPEVKICLSSRHVSFFGGRVVCPIEIHQNTL